MKKKENSEKSNRNGLDKANNKGLIAKYIIGITSLIFAVLFIYRERSPVESALVVGEIAANEVRASVDFNYIDNKATENLRQEAIANVPNIYYIDPLVKDEAVRKVDELFAEIEKKTDIEVLKEKIGWLDDEIAIKTLLQTPNLPSVKNSVLKVLNEILEKGIITSSTKIKVISRGSEVVRLRDLKTNNLSELNVDKFIVQEDLSSVIDARLKTILPFNRPLRQALKEILLKVLVPNVVYDSEEIKRLQETARQSVVPAVMQIKKGQTIIRQGDPVTETHKAMLDAQIAEINKSLPRFGRLWGFTGTSLFVGLLFFILITYLHYHQEEIFSCNKRLLLLGIIIIFTLVLSRIIISIPVNPDKPFLQYFILVPAGIILIAMLMDKELAIICSMIMSILVTTMADRTLPYAVCVLFGCIVAIQVTTGILHRWEFIKAGIIIGIAQMLAVFMINVWKLNPMQVFQWSSFLYQIAGSLTAGICYAMIVSICLPILERVFNITTDIWLLELSNLNHPLLKMMITEAPGTYHHSIIVSNMAEDAASAVGANPFLAKAGGYFHDIGKIAKPEYFAENIWFEDQSRHEKLQPSMSNLVITAHVKDGVQLAKEYRLPKVIIDIINEHHGTSLVYYFYKQAEIASKEEGVEISEVDFRYPGPKPSTKESAIILLADAVEAASKTLVKPTHLRIEDLVKEISNEKINDGQLDESGLTLEDIAIIRERFCHILTGILHKRVEYPVKNGN